MQEQDQTNATNIKWHNLTIDRDKLEKMRGHKGMVIWFTGLSGSGKSTLANALNEVLHKEGLSTYILDGDNIRHGLSKDLGFSKEDRKENIRRISEVAKLMTDAGIIVITAFITPYADDRKVAKEVIGNERIVEVYIDTPLEICESRDPKELYKKARLGKITNFTGISDPFDIPINPDITISTQELSAEKAAETIINFLKDNGNIY